MYQSISDIRLPIGWQ